MYNDQSNDYYKFAQQMPLEQLQWLSYILFYINKIAHWLVEQVCKSVTWSMIYKSL